MSAIEALKQIAAAIPPEEKLSAEETGALPRPDAPVKKTFGGRE